MCPVSLFFVISSPCREWVICAPAAFLGCGSCYSGSLSGIEPLFRVTRYNLGRRRTYHRQLIRQTSERCVAGARRPCDQHKVIQSHQNKRWTNRPPPICLDLIKAFLPFLRGISFDCISSRITTVIQVNVVTIYETITDLISHSRF